MLYNPLISVIVPVFNVERWVEESLASICNQSYRNLEIILVNDGSTDNSRSICERYVISDSRVRLIDQDNHGLSVARNTGIEAAQGEYIIFVDSDDVLHKDHVTLLFQCLVRNKVEIALSTMTAFSKKFNMNSLVVGPDEKMTSNEAIKTMFYQGDFDSCAQAKLYSRKLWNSVRFPVGYLHEDLPTTYKVFLKTNEVAFFKSNTYGYRYNIEGINHSPTNDKKVETLLLLDETVKELESMQIDLAKAAKCLRASYALHLLLNSTNTSLSAFNKERIRNSIVDNRREVILDSHARKKTRMALLLSFFGWKILDHLFIRLNRRHRKAY